MKKRECKGGFTYAVTEEAIREYIALPIEQKLAWLEEANRFTYNTLTPKNREIWEAFRAGKI